MKTNIIVKCVASIFLLAISFFGAVKGYDSFRKVESSLLLDGIEAKAGIIDDFCEWYIRPDYNWVQRYTCEVQVKVAPGTVGYEGFTYQSGCEVIITYHGHTYDCVKTEKGKGTQAHCPSQMKCYIDS